MENNLFYLLLCDDLPVQDHVIVVCLIRPDLRPDKTCFYDVFHDDLQGLPVSLIHSQEKEREHDDDHAQCRQTDISQLFEQKKKTARR